MHNAQFRTFSAFKSQPPPVVPQFEISDAVPGPKAKAPDDAGALNSSVVPDRIGSVFCSDRTFADGAKAVVDAEQDDLEVLFDVLG